MTHGGRDSEIWEKYLVVVGRHMWRPSGHKAPICGHCPGCHCDIAILCQYTLNVQLVWRPSGQFSTSLWLWHCAKCHCDIAFLRRWWTVRGLVVKCPTSAVRLMSARCSKISLIIHNRRVSIRSQQEITQFEYLLHKSCTLDVEEHLQCRLYTPLRHRDSVATGAGVWLLRRPRQPWTVRGGL